ncbi:MAG: hypothetical protein ABFC80_06065 [Coriobacteriales bacterium]|nr:ATP-binding protein [Actinomycetes bacterium]
MALDQVSLIVPARSEYAKTVRMTAAELGSRLGMSYDDVDDVRMATEEAFVYASACVGESEPIGFTFTVAEDELTVLVGPLPEIGCGDADTTPEDRYAAFILESVCDTYEVLRSSGTCTLRLVKRVSDTTPKE